MQVATRPGPLVAPARDRESRTRDAVDLTARQLADAVAEFDRALDERCPMPVLVKLDQEVAAATRRHDAALARLACCA